MFAINKPYLLLVGDMANPRNAKTALGLRDWAPEDCLGQLLFTEDAVDLGLPNMTPREAAAAGAKTMVIGIAPQGGALPESWHQTLCEALKAGLDIASGLHMRLREIPEIAELASALGRELHDVRHNNRRFAVGTGVKRPGLRLLTVGTDCALGKKYTALAITKSAKARGLKADFRATGQTGILISGGGVAVDAIIGDFISGAAETLSPANEPDHWDIIEGQGSLLHPAYAPVTLGLLHGSQPDAMVMCHDPLRATLNGFPHVPCASIADAMEAFLPPARVTNPKARFVGVSLNTGAMSASEAADIIAKTEDEIGLPCFDSIRTGADAIAEVLEKFDAS